MTDADEGENDLNDVVMDACDFKIANLMDSYDRPVVNGGNCLATCGDSPKRSNLPALTDMALLTDDSSDSLCRVDLPNDLVVSSPMKIADILSLLMESPEKPTTMENNAMEEGTRVANEDAVNGDDTTPSSNLMGTFSLVRRSHSCQTDVDGHQRRISYERCHSSASNNCQPRATSVLQRSKSLDNIFTVHHYEQSSALFPAASWFPSISGANSGVDAIADLLYSYDTANIEQQETVTPAVSILGYTLPLVTVEGDPTAYVCATDVFQTFFSTRHWDEFKSILEKNGIRCVSTAVSSVDNAFGVPEVVDVIDVKQVELLLLTNQARKDGFVRCVRLDMNDGTDGTVRTHNESKIVMMPERHVGELSSGIRTRHADQSDIMYVELEGQTLPCIILKGVQYVRLVDVQKKFFSGSSANDDKQQQQQQQQLSPPGSTKNLNVLRSACSYLNIDLKKCKQNDKSRMVVYANSLHSNSLHIIAASDLPKLIEYMRTVKRRGWKKYRSQHLSTDQTAFGGSLRISVADTDGSNYSWSASTPGGMSQVSPLSRPDSVDSADTGTSSSFTLSTGPSSPVETGKKRRASWNIVGGSAAKRQHTSRFRSYLEDREMDSGKFTTTGTSSMSIWHNGHLKKLSSHDSSFASFTGQPVRATSNSGLESPASSLIPIAQDVNLVNSACDLDLGRDEDKLLDVLTPKLAISPCRIVMAKSTPLPVAVYNRRGCRGPAGKYFDHLFVSRNGQCIWCYGCQEFYGLHEFVTHTHHGQPSVPNPQLFMWVSNSTEANLDLWRSLLEKSRMYNLKHVVGYELPDNLQLNRDDGKSEKDADYSSVRDTSRTDSRSSREPVLGGAPVPPAPVSFRRRQARGDVFMDVMERFSVSHYKPPMPSLVGLNSDEREKEIDAAYSN